MNQSPTTGPWTAKGPDISDADGTRIATCGITHNYAANARLIAACPVAREIGRQSGVKPASRAAEYLSGRKTPHPDLARAMERVILMMVEQK